MYNRISSKSRGSVRKHMEIHISACGKFRIKSILGLEGFNTMVKKPGWGQRVFSNLS